MFSGITQSQYQQIIESLNNHCFNVTSVPISSNDFTVTENSISAVISLPDSNKRLSDYAAVLLWVHTDSYYSAISLSSKVSACYGSDNPHPDSPLLVFSLADNGIGSASFSAHNTDPNDSFDPSDFLSNVCSVMFLSSNVYLPLTPDNSFIFNSLEEALNFFDISYQYSSYNILDDKKYLIVLDESNSYLPNVYKLRSREAVQSDDYELKEDKYGYYYLNSIFKANWLKLITASSDDLGLEGIDLSDDANTSHQDKLAKGTYNTKIINSFFELCSEKRDVVLEFSDNKVYYLNSCLYLGSNLKILGNNATLKLVDFDAVNHVGKELAIFYNKNIGSDNNPVYLNEKNITIKDLNLVGRNYAGSDCEYGDQCFHYDNSLIQNLVLDNVTISNFSYGIHLSYGDHFVDENNKPIFINWVIKNSKIIKCVQNNMLSSVNGMKYINCYIDNSLGKSARDHAFYLGVRCSYITIEKCLIENSRGYGIKQDSQTSLQFDEYSHDNVFRDITIHNCYRGVWIGCISKNILVENVFAYGVLRGIVLESCIDVTVNNFNATSTEINRLVSRYGDNIELYAKGSADYAMIELKGKVKARFNNCYFKTDFIMFSHNQYHNSAGWDSEVVLSTKGAVNEQSGTELYFVKEKHGKNKPDSWVDDNYAFLTDVEFCNCTFDSKYIQNKLGIDLLPEYTQSNTDVTTVETITKPGSAETKFVRVTNYNVMYQSNYAFYNCKFSFWVTCSGDTDDNGNITNNKTKAALVFRGNGVVPSHYFFDDCLFTYYVMNKDKVQNLSNCYLMNGKAFDNDVNSLHFITNISPNCIIATNLSGNRSNWLPTGNDGNRIAFTYPDDNVYHYLKDLTEN